MQILKDIFARIWALWGLITFIVTFIIIFPFSMIAYLIPDPQGQRYFIFVSRIWMRIWLTLILCPVRVRGLENFKHGENYVIVFNHNALLDVPLSAPFVYGPNKTIAKDSFAKVPIFGWFYSKGSVLVNRKSEASRKKSYLDMRNVLAKGMHMCIYPEGTRNRTKEPLKEFYPGAFKLAKDSGHSVLPCIIYGTKEAMPIHKKFYLLPTFLRMEYLEPIPVKDKTVDELKDLAFQRMKDAVVRNK